MNGGVAKRAVFKCAFSGKHGWGHVVRSSALAEAFQRRGWETVLWAADDVSQLPRAVASAFSEARRETAEDASVLVVDEMYTSDSAYAELANRWRALPGKRVLAGVDDMQLRSMGAFDLVVNTEIGLRTAAYRSDRSLLGERYALLRTGFRSPAPLEPWDLPADAIPVLVMLGGTDAFAYAERVLKCLRSWRGERIAPVLVLGEGVKNREGIVDTLREFEDRRLLERLEASQLAAWMRRCAFGVIACGTTLYEAAAMRLPFVGLSVVDNQSATAQKVHQHWGMPVVSREGRHDEPLNLSAELESVVAMEHSAYSEVDTLGSERVCEAILAVVA